MLLSPDLLAMLSLVSNILGTLCLFFVIRLKPYGEFPLPHALVIRSHRPWLVPLGWILLLGGFIGQFISLWLRG